MGAIAYPIIHNWGLDARLTGVDRRLSAVEGRGGIGAPKAAQEREEMAIMELMQAVQNGKEVKEALGMVASKYPDVALKYVKKMGVKM